MYSPIYDAKERVYEALNELKKTIETFGDFDSERDNLLAALNAVAHVKNEWE